MLYVPNLVRFRQKERNATTIIRKFEEYGYQIAANNEKYKLKMKPENSL